MRIVKVLLGSGWRSSDQDVTSFLATKVERTESRSGEGSAGLLSETGYGPDYRFGKRPVMASDVGRDRSLAKEVCRLTRAEIERRLEGSGRSLLEPDDCTDGSHESAMGWCVVHSFSDPGGRRSPSLSREGVD